MSALLNLVDFADDSPTIQALAEQVAGRLLKECLMFTTAEGHFYPIAGRGKGENFLDPRFFSITWMILGTGFPLLPDAWRDEYVGAFLATSSFDLQPIADAFEPIMNEKFEIGHAIEDHRQIHSTLSRLDRTLNQWSSGDIVQPEVVNDSLYVATQYLIPGPRALSLILRFILPLLGGALRFLSPIFKGNIYGTSMVQAKGSIFKNGGVALSSLQDYHVGCRGFQQYPVMATVSDIAIWTQSGVAGRCFTPEQITNVHLPQVMQDGNVALISYRPKSDVRLISGLLSLFGNSFSTIVSLRFPEDRFDEVREVESRWIIGRKDSNYVGVWRHALDKFDCSSVDAVCEEYYYSDSTRDQHTSSWVIVVGNADTHGDFSQFENTISAGQVHEELTRKGLFRRPDTYEVQVTVDSKTLRLQI